ncbi:hypothetical protein [Geodermatophilus sabuli]|uniref:Uncharacterized protein n=1 Tax=Geodermatophilus sabuli TaxID=1564158 RepID=A0A285EEH8_9ACTN|nr:hypothetical protein [Geodermatophilus sabuli]MBB3086340.1 hypothetical protein [Geodermatophilus sabuli]SNX97445.1 hypothetical protein SAMN06893097_10786 [Geodermatophilus sabuli]
MSHPTTSPQPVATPDVPGTQEIPVAGATATGTQHLPRIEDQPTAPGPGSEPPVQPTGPVDFVPGLPGVGTPPPPAPTKAPRTPRTAAQRAALAGAGLTVVSLLLLELGLALPFGAESFWTTVPLWSVFATLATLLGLLPSAARLLGTRLRPGTAWRAAAGGLTGLAVFWVLVVLPRADSDRGFLLTAALAALGAALWTAAPTRRD